MQLSLSVRIAESFLSKEESTMNLAEVCDLAKSAGYDAICMRGSQVGVHSSPQDHDAAEAVLKQQAMPVSMLTGDFATVYNNEHGPDSLRNITPYLDLADRLGTKRIRVAIKQQEDIPHAQRAAEEAADRGMTLLHQCHIQSLFETVDSIVATLEAIDRPNFRLIYEPANLEECEQPYGQDAIGRLAPWIDNVYLQNQRIHPDGNITLETWHRGPVTFDLLAVHEPGGIDFPSIITALKGIGYDGYITVHQSAPPEGSAVDAAKETAVFLHGLIDA